MTTQKNVWMRSREKFSPRAEQIRGMQLILKGQGARLFLHPGKGKTGTVLKSFQLLKEKGLVDCLLVLAPLRVVTTSWPSELNKWSDFDDLTYVTIHGDRKAAMAKKVDVYLMNYEGLLSPEWRDARGLSFLKGRRWMLAVDESTKMKNSGSQRFKSLKKLLPAIDYKVIMTGTPKPNKLEDLFSQCYITDGGRDLGKFVTHFRHEYMMQSYDGFGYVEQPGAFERVSEKIAPTTLQIAYEEAVPSQTVPIWVPMPPSVATVYEELKNEFLTVIGDDPVMAPNSAASLNKLRQMAQGFVYMPEGDPKDLHDGKIDALENIVEELDGEPLFVLVQYREDVVRIRARLGAEIPYIGSGTSATAGAAAVAAFGAGRLPILLGHPQSVAHGVDGLQQNCGNVCWYGMDWSWENYYQANLRIVRSGSKADQVFIYQIMMDCGVERAMLASVLEKQKSEARFLSLLRENL